MYHLGVRSTDLPCAQPSLVGSRGDARAVWAVRHRIDQAGARDCALQTTCVGIPDPYRPVIAARDDVPALRAVRHGVDRLQMPGQVGFPLTRMRIPNPHRPIISTGGDKLAVRAVRHRAVRYRLSVNPQNCRFGSGVRIPDPYRVVAADRGDAAAVRAVRHGPDPAVGVSHDEQLFARCGIPDPQRPIFGTARGDAASVGTEGHRVDGPLVALPHGSQLTRMSIPCPHYPVIASRDDAPAVWTVCDLRWNVRPVLQLVVCLQHDLLCARVGSHDPYRPVTAGYCDAAAVRAVRHR